MSDDGETSGSGSGADGPLTRADIPEVVKAVVAALSTSHEDTGEP